MELQLDVYKRQAVTSTEGRCVVFHTAALNPKTTRSTRGVNVMTLSLIHI